jgi:hypothetical protein
MLSRKPVKKIGGLPNPAMNGDRPQAALDRHKLNVFVQLISQRELGL